MQLSIRCVLGASLLLAGIACDQKESARPATPQSQGSGSKPDSEQGHSTSSTAQPPVQAKPDLAKAKELVAAGLFQQAISELTPMVEKFPTNAEVHLLLGHAFLCQGETDKAYESFDRSVRLAPDSTKEIVKTVLSEFSKARDRSPQKLEIFAATGAKYDPTTKKAFAKALGQDALRAAKENQFTVALEFFRSTGRYAQEELIALSSAVFEALGQDLGADKALLADVLALLRELAGKNSDIKNKSSRVYFELGKSALSTGNLNRAKSLFSVASEFDAAAAKESASLMLEKARGGGTALKDLQTFLDIAACGIEFERTTSAEFGKSLLSIVQANAQDMDHGLLVTQLKRIAEWNQPLTEQAVNITLDRLRRSLALPEINVGEVTGLGSCAANLVSSSKAQVSSVVLQGLTAKYENLPKLGKSRFLELVKVIEEFGLSETDSASPEWQFTRSLRLYVSGQRENGVASMESLKAKQPREPISKALLLITGPIPPGRVDIGRKVQVSQFDIVDLVTLTHMEIGEGGIELFFDADCKSETYSTIRWDKPELPLLVDNAGGSFTSRAVNGPFEDSASGSKANVTISRLRTKPGAGNKFSFRFPLPKPGATIVEVKIPSCQSLYEVIRWGFKDLRLKQEPFGEQTSEK